MQPQVAKYMCEFLLPQVEQENHITRRILEAVPESQREYRPHADARSAFELCWHTVCSQIWFLDGVVHGQLGSDQERMPAHIRSVADVLAWHEANVPALVEAIQTLPAERLLCELDYYGVFSGPAVSFLNISLLHTAHHRGQLTAYLRGMGAKVPRIYGGSADEPFYAMAEL